jgi:MAP/microtubule affinity-regulating kinase
VVHRDIKLENILIDQNSSVKLIDFGFSIVIAENQKLNVFCGTPSYMAPEIVNKQEYDFGVDIWALGVLFYKIVTGNFPFRGIFVKNIARTRR